MPDDPYLRLSTWNVEWAAPGTQRGRRVAEVLGGAGDVLVITECELGLLPEGHVIDAGADWGYGSPSPDRRKVAMWSAAPWTDVDVVGSPDLPGGRFVAATTDPGCGPVRVVGVCVPWRGAHVTTGRQDRDPWEDYLEFLEHLAPVLARQPHPLAVAGDLNQRIPRTRQPHAAFDLLIEAFHGLHVPTADIAAPDPLIDHIALSPDIAVHAIGVLPARTEAGRMSDHTGVGVVAAASD